MSVELMPCNNFDEFKHLPRSCDTSCKKKKVSDDGPPISSYQQDNRRTNLCSSLWQKTPNALNPIIPVLPLRIISKHK